MRWSIHSYRSCQPELPRNQTSLQESIFCCLQLWYFWEQLQCVVHSPLIVGITLALLFSLGTCIVQIQSVWVNFACTKRLFNLSAEATINARNARLCVRCAIFFFKIKEVLFIVSLSGGLHFWREPKNSSRCYWRCLLSWQVLFQQREMRIYWWWCNTPRSSSACGNCGAWLFVHKVPFMLQEHVKTTKTDKLGFFFPRKRWTWYPTINYYLMSHFNQPNKERKNCVWTTKYERLSEMCIVQHVEMKSVFTIQPIKRPASTTVKSAKPAATFWIFLLGTKNRQLCCLAVTVHIVFQKRRIATTKKKNHLHLRRNFSTNHNQAHPNLNQKRLNWV